LAAVAVVLALLPVAVQLCIRRAALEAQAVLLLVRKPFLPFRQRAVEAVEAVFHQQLLLGGWVVVATLIAEEDQETVFRPIRFFLNLHTRQHHRRFLEQAVLHRATATPPVQAVADQLNG
jgi:hypothetical protein